MRPSWGLVIVVDSAVLSPSFVLVYTPGLRAYSHLLYSYYVEFLCAAWYQSCLRLVADNGGTEYSPSRKVVSKGKEKIVRSEEGEGDNSPL